MLVRAKASRLCRPSSRQWFDHEDAEQEIWLQLSRKAGDFDPARGGLHTFADRVATSAVCEIVRNGRRLKRGGSATTVLLSDLAPGDHEKPISNADSICDADLGRRVGRSPEVPIESAERRSDVDVALRLISPDLADLWLRLADESEAAVARALDVSRRTIRAKKSRLKRDLERFGLGSD